MASLEDGIKGRTVDNGSIHSTDQRIVWEVRAVLRLPCTRSQYNEVVRTGEYVNEERVYHFLAPASEALIRALWAERMRFNVEVIGEPTFKPLCCIDGEIKWSHK